MPARTIASISSEVATGRWMKGRDGLMAASRLGGARAAVLRPARAVAGHPRGRAGRAARAVAMVMGGAGAVLRRRRRAALATMAAPGARSAARAAVRA